MSRPVDAAAAWIYSGVWASVVALFRVPAQPPTLPAAGEQVRSLRPSPGFLRYLKFRFWLLLIPGDVIPIVVWLVIWNQSPTLGIILVLPLLIVLVVPDILAYVAIHLRYDTTWYVLTDRSVRIRRGIWVIHETTISFENVQNVEVRQGPVQRHFGIADVIVQTAGGGAGHGKGEHSSSQGAHVGILQGLDDAHAVRDLILDRVRRTRSAGLGDERATTSAADRGSAPAFSPAHLSLLREIRDGARRMSRADLFLCLLLFASGLGAASAGSSALPVLSALPRDRAQTEPVIVIQAYHEGLAGVRAANPAVHLSIGRDPSVPGEPVLMVEYPMATADPAGRDVQCDAESQDWTAGRAISVHVKPDQPVRLSFSFLDRNRVAYTAWTELKGGVWQAVRIPFDEIRPNPYFQPPGAKTGSPIDVSQVTSIAFAPQGQTAGRLAIGKFVVSQ